MAKWQTKRVSIARRDGEGNHLFVIAEQETFKYEKSRKRGNKHFPPEKRGEAEKAVREYERQRDRARQG